MTEEERRKYMKQYYQANRERLKEYQKQYHKEYYQTNKEKILEQYKEYYQVNKQKHYEWKKEYNNTPMGRAHMLLSAYNQADNKYNRGKGDLTAQWIVERIFSQPCAHCGKEGWDVIGCNRLDNSKPHTMDNVEPCCKECNDRLPKKNK